ncbi:MAG: hypothetical protein E7325_11925 [Clostridiales bacterium]|nr:hypothetical protein [Clostridiales bacterium]
MLGGAALWWANPVSSMLLLIFTFVMNRRMVRTSGGQLHGLLLIPREQKALQTINASLGLSRNEIARFGHKFQTMCEQNGMEPRNAAISAFAVEELLLNVLEARKIKDYADISARIYPDRMVIDFRTLGPAFQAEEMKLLQNQPDDHSPNGGGDELYTAGTGAESTHARGVPCPPESGFKNRVIPFLRKKDRCPVP